MSAEFWAFVGLALVVWLSADRVIARIDKLEAATRRPVTLTGEDEVLEELRAIAGHAYNAELDRQA